METNGCLENRECIYDKGTTTCEVTDMVCYVSMCFFMADFCHFLSSSCQLSPGHVRKLGLTRKTRDRRVGSTL